MSLAATEVLWGSKLFPPIIGYYNRLHWGYIGVILGLVIW